MARWKRNEKLGKKRDDFSENACYTGSVQKVNEAAGWESAACTANALVPFFSNIKQHILYLFP